jgi:DNA-binding transcriptional regulator YdaS (Cro superfamily)
LETGLLPAFRVVTTFIQLLVAGFVKWEAVLEATAVAAQHFAKSLIADFSGVGQIVDAAIHGHFDQIPAIVRAASSQVTNELMTGALEWGNAYERGEKAADAVFKQLAADSKATGAEIVADADKVSKSKEKIAKDWLAKDNDALQKELDQHLKTQSKISEGELAIIIRENDEKIKENNKVLSDSMENAMPCSTMRARPRRASLR